MPTMNTYGNQSPYPNMFSPQGAGMQGYASGRPAAFTPGFYGSQAPRQITSSMNLYSPAYSQQTPTSANAPGQPVVQQVQQPASSPVGQTAGPQSAFQQQAGVGSYQQGLAGGTLTAGGQSIADIQAQRQPQQPQGPTLMDTWNEYLNSLTPQPPSAPDAAGGSNPFFQRITPEQAALREEWGLSPFGLPQPGSPGFAEWPPKRENAIFGAPIVGTPEFTEAMQKIIPGWQLPAVPQGTVLPGIPGIIMPGTEGAPPYNPAFGAGVDPTLLPQYPGGPVPTVPGSEVITDTPPEDTTTPPTDTTTEPGTDTDTTSPSEQITPGGLFTEQDTQAAINQAAAEQFAQADPTFLQQYFTNLGGGQRGVSSDAGTQARMMFPQNEAIANISQTQALQPLMDQMQNEQFRFALEQARNQLVTGEQQQAIGQQGQDQQNQLNLLTSLLNMFQQFSNPGY